MLTPDPLFFFFTLSLSYNKLPEASIRFLPCACAPFSWAEAPPPTANSTPFLCSCAKKRGGAPKKRAFGCRHGTCSVPPASPTNSKPQHPSRLPQADLSAQTTTRPRPKSGEERNDHQSSSAHANGGAAGVKSAFLWRLDTVSLGKHQRNGVEWQDRVTTPTQRIGAHAQT